jgi:hypothetical protein
MPDSDAVVRAAPVPRIRVAKAREVPPGAVRVFGAVLWRNRYAYRTRNGLARVPAVEGGGEWEYEGRISAAGMRHDYFHPEGHVPPRTTCHVRYMTRRECQETYRRVLTGELTPALAHHRPLVSLPEVVEALKGKTLACTCPFPKEGDPDWCHAAVLAHLAAALEVARLDCIGDAAAKAVAREADRPGQNRAVAFGSRVFLSYFDKRYPLDVAGWAFENGHADDDAAGSLIGRL